MNHFTNKAGFNGIRSHPVWKFLALQPPPVTHPPGAYFTDYAATEPNLAKKLRIPREKLRYLFQFEPPTPLLPLPGGRGQFKRIFYSPNDYLVARDFQGYHGESGLP
ncbi:MAG: hypothetical protein HY791_14185 [Deltaproteobacteria bacterium]|nr:hypothetical protein [Deltaproteobacteria bacterium]